MKYDRVKWYNSSNPDRLAANISARILLVVLVIALLSGAAWAVNVATSGIRGQGDAVAQRNAAANRIEAQGRFESLWAEVKATDAKLDALAEASAADPTDRKARTDLLGTKTYCLSVIADYNAAARKYTSEQFRAADLPFEIDTTDPATDCKETTR